MKWTDEAIDAAIVILGESRRTEDAAATFSSKYKVEVTNDSMKHGFNAARKRGRPLGTLASYLKSGFSGAHIADLADDDQPTTPRLAPRDTMPAPPPEPSGELPETPDRAFVAPAPRSWSMPKSGSSRWLLIPDTHAPFHDSIAWRCMLNAARVARPDGIVVIGDFADFYAVSFHEKNPARSSRLVDELPCINERLDELDSLGARTKVFCRGNHEARLDRYIAENAKALLGFPGLSMNDAFRLTKRGWVDVPYLATYAVGDCVFTHTITKYGGQNAHRNIRDAYNTNAVQGHTHKLSWEIRGDFFGGSRVGMTIGSLMSFDLVEHEHKAKAAKEWHHGFGLGTLDHETGRMHLQPIAITHGRCSVDGRVVSA